MTITAECSERFTRITLTLSLTVIHYFVDDFLSNETQFTGDDLTAMQRIWKSNDLDEIHMIAHERLGNTENVEVLRAWIAEKPARAALAASIMEDMESMDD